MAVVNHSLPGAEMILNDTKMSISELNRLDTVSKRSKKDRLINELNEAKKTY